MMDLFGFLNLNELALGLSQMSMFPYFDMAHYIVSVMSLREQPGKPKSTNFIVFQVVCCMFARARVQYVLVCTALYSIWLFTCNTNALLFINMLCIVLLLSLCFLSTWLCLSSGFTSSHVYVKHTNFVFFLDNHQRRSCVIIIICVIVPRVSDLHVFLFFCIGKKSSTCLRRAFTFINIAARMHEMLYNF